MSEKESILSEIADQKNDGKDKESITEEEKIIRIKVYLAQYDCPEGINLKRVNEFIEQHGLTPISAYLIPEEKWPEVIEKLIAEGFIERSDKEHLSLGKNIERLKIAIVKRSKIFEDAGGSITTEGLVVHELAHHREIPYSLGSFFEESFADLMRVKYLEQHMTEEEKKKTFSRFQGGTGTITLNRLVDNLASGYWLPTKYYLPSLSKNLDSLTPSIAAFTLELLCRIDKKLLGDFIRSRKNDESFLNVILRIKKILGHEKFEKLTRISYSTASFIEGFRIVGESIYFDEAGHWEVPLYYDWVSEKAP